MWVNAGDSFQRRENGRKKGKSVGGGKEDVVKSKKKE